MRNNKKMNEIIILILIVDYMLATVIPEYISYGSVKRKYIYDGNLFCSVIMKNKWLYRVLHQLKDKIQRWIINHMGVINTNGDNNVLKIGKIISSKNNCS